MKHNKRFKTLNDISPERDIGYITARPKRGAKSELDACKELHALLRDHTYHMISLINSFHDIARIYGVFHGSNWRSYRGMPTDQLKSIANKLNTMDATDFHAVIGLERELEAIAESLSKKAVSNE